MASILNTITPNEKVGDAISKLSNAVSNAVIGKGGFYGDNSYLRQFSNMFSYLGNRGISLAIKNRMFTENALSLNEYAFNNETYDGIGPYSIGRLSDPSYNSHVLPWFIGDVDISDKENYIDYITNTYFGENGSTTPLINLMSQEQKVATFDPNSLKLESNEVGSVRGFNFEENIEFGDVKSNNNNNLDTRLGMLGSFYLSHTLKTSDEAQQNIRNNGYGGITNKIYDEFRLSGEYGIKSANGDYNTVLENIKQVIPWSTADNYYGDAVNVKGVYKDNETLLDNYYGTSSSDDNYSDIFDDERKGFNKITKYSNYGNYYSLTYSEGLLFASSEKVQGFIAKSMLGYDLMGNEDIKFDPDVNDYSSVSRKKYYARLGIGKHSSNYIDMMTNQHVEFIHYGRQDELNDTMIRLELEDAGNDNLFTSRQLYVYAETEVLSKKIYERTLTQEYGTFNGGIDLGTYKIYEHQTLSNKKDLIFKTNRDFLKKKYGTLIARFHTDADKDGAPRDMISTAVSNQYGMSHGRNLLKKNHKGSKTNNYSDPYCRVWTYHKQYHRLLDTIRPFQTTEGSEGEFLFGDEKRLHLANNGVKNTSNRLVRFCPTKEDPNSIARCMFSIENLAWKNESTNPSVGPNGGRIMWFPPYNLSFSENVTASWNANSFIGRGEKIYTYTDTERGGTLRFKLLIDHPSIVDNWRSDVSKNIATSGVDDVESSEQTLLRFFAGCEILDASNNGNSVFKESDTNDKDWEAKQNTPSNGIKREDAVVEKVTNEDKIVFFVYFPNNYSGYDDSYNGDVKPMWYLINGKNGNYDNCGTTNVPTTLDETFLGYEMRDKGITQNPYFDKKCTDKTKEALVCKDRDGKYMNFWWYRVDSKYKGQVMHHFTSDEWKNTEDWKTNQILYDDALNPYKNDDPSPFENTETKTYQSRYLNYCDCWSYKLNSINYEKVAMNGGHPEMKQYVENGKLVSFTDVFRTIEGGSAEELLSDCTTDTDGTIKEHLDDLFSNYEITSINFVGYASNQGYTVFNNGVNGLAKNRANSVYAWLKNSKYSAFKNCQNITITSKEQENTNGYTDKYNNSDLLAKLWRCVKVELNFHRTEITEPNKGVDNVEYLDDRGYRDILANKTNTLYDYAQKVAEDMKAKAQVEAMKSGNSGNVAPKSYTTYDYDESKYFTELKKNEPFLHHKITEKIKYFDPAFHSMSPEGFNARLTFLHQCTRQGSTYGSSEGGNARNMAFGAPPVCVLRIGDFYNTRIIIESLNITYDNNGIQWDLNDEGIGVMPMMADIDLTFKFIGGSDLEGPIRRLQNAVSFNYYANTSVYDTTAEKASDEFVESTEIVEEVEENEGESQANGE